MDMAGAHPGLHREFPERSRIITVEARFLSCCHGKSTRIRHMSYSANRAAEFEARMDHPAPNDALPVEHPGSRKRRRAVARAPQAHRLPTLIAPDVEAEALLRSTLDALSAHIAVLDEAGTIIAVNQAWRAFAHASGYADGNHGVGMNYLAVCEAAAAVSQDAARPRRRCATLWKAPDPSSGWSIPAAAHRGRAGFSSRNAARSGADPPNRHRA